MKRLYFLLHFTAVICFGQSANTNPSDLHLTSEDSLSIFLLIDSLINLEPEKENSQLALRIGYSSNINASESPLKLNEFGFTTQASYYHKSGLYLDATGYWSNQSNPIYYLTIASIGYMHYSLKKWSFMLEYSRYFYNTNTMEDVTIVSNYNTNYSSPSYENSLTLTTFFQHKEFNFRFDYLFLTGDRTGHRFNPVIFYSFNKRNWHGFQKVSFYPTLSILWGIEEYDSYYIKLFNSRAEAIYRIRHQLPLFEEIPAGHDFGVMNYGVRLPISLMKNKWGFTFSYAYNFPQRLKHVEGANISSGGNLAFSVVRYFEIKDR